MKLATGILTLSLALLGAASPVTSGEDLATQRRVHGVITAASPAAVTIATSQNNVTGKIDPARTRVTVHGKPAKVSDLELTSHAKGELCLDDVWVAIDVH